MPKVHTYEECKPHLDSLANTARHCIARKRVVSCANCNEENSCTTQINYESWLKRSRKSVE